MATFNKTGSEGTTVSFTSAPTEVEGGTAGNFEFDVNVGEADDTKSLDVEVKAFLYVAGTNEQSIVSSTSAVATENDVIQGTLSHVFPTNSARNKDIEESRRLLELDDNRSESRQTIDSYEDRIDEPVWIKVEVDYFGASGYNRGNTDEEASTTDVSVNVTAPEDESEFRTFSEDGARTGEDTLSGTFSNTTPFAVKQIDYEEDATYIESVFSDAELTDNGYQISFDYPNPTVSIDTAGRFAKHEIIGGSTVRQKIGEDPINVSVSGVCKRRTANQIDSLRDARSGVIFSDRLPGSGDSLRVQFGSTNTEPMTDGGSADLKDGRFLYSFQINCIEVIR